MTPPPGQEGEGGEQVMATGEGAGGEGSGGGVVRLEGGEEGGEEHAGLDTNETRQLV